jgi:hypothetical protein
VREHFDRLPSRRTLWMQAVGFCPIDRSAKCVAWAIGAHMNPEGVAWPGRARIARFAGFKTPKTVDRQIRLLEEVGLLEIVRRSKGGNGVTNVYGANIPEYLWHDFKNDALVEQAVEEGVLVLDEHVYTPPERGHLGVPVHLPQRGHSEPETGTSAARNGDTTGLYGDSRKSLEVVEDLKLKNEDSALVDRRVSRYDQEEQDHDNELPLDQETVPIDLAEEVSWP